MSKARANAWSRGESRCLQKVRGLSKLPFSRGKFDQILRLIPPDAKQRGHTTARAQGQGDWEREARQPADGSPAAACLRAVYKRVFNRILTRSCSRCTLYNPCAAASQQTAENESLSLTPLTVCNAKLETIHERR